MINFDRIRWRLRAAAATLLLLCGIGLEGSAAATPIGTFTQPGTDVNLATATCSDYFDPRGMDNAAQMALLSWIFGYAAGRQATTITSMKGLGFVKMQVDYICKRQPTLTVFEAARIARTHPLSWLPAD